MGGYPGKWKGKREGPKEMRLELDKEMPSDVEDTFELLGFAFRGRSLWPYLCCFPAKPGPAAEKQALPTRSFSEWTPVSQDREPECSAGSCTQDPTYLPAQPDCLVCAQAAGEQVKGACFSELTGGIDMAFSAQ